MPAATALLTIPSRPEASIVVDAALLRLPALDVSWRLHPKGYAIHGYHETTYLHRLIAAIVWGEAAVEGMDVHHVNHQPSDNRIENLQILTHAEHNRVTGEESRTDPNWGTAKHGSRWKAQVRIGGKVTYLGLFPSREEAHSWARICVEAG